MASVSFHQVSKTFRGRRGEEISAVQDFSLEVANEEFVVLLGPSGCGKTTTLRIAAGLESLTSGEIRIDGRRVNDVPPGERDLAMVFQNYALYPHLTVAENMGFGLRMRGLPRPQIDKRVREAAAILGIEALLPRRPAGLSGGQQQRVAVGRAIVRQPKAFLFDEPLSNLDAKMRTQLRTELIKLHQRLKATIIYVTHDQSEAMTMGQRIVVMRDGIAQQTGPPLEVYHRPANIFVGGFLGSPPMNFVRGTLKTGPAGLVFKEMQGGSLEIQLAARPALVPMLDREVVMGLRPEDLQPLLAGEIPTPRSFQAQVDILEPTGAECICYLQTGANTITCRSRRMIDQRETGHRMIFDVAADRVLFFDPNTSALIV